ncbi:Ig-specific serine endopeptidase MIP [Mycoplasma leonicaptivi]|uniref:Ig-specific serine endopeptidase MIP n=1 Tax=Mycoplasma leonicaptivi TaxID=36742 RepID=UPI00047FE93C|nr:DUF31 family protein [Mycoplasma leonicaptivi]
MKKIQKMKLLVLGTFAITPMAIAASCQENTKKSDTNNNKLPTESEKKTNGSQEKETLNGSGSQTQTPINYFNNEETQKYIKNKSFDDIFNVSLPRYKFQDKTAEEFRDHFEEWVELNSKETRLKWSLLNVSVNKNELNLFINFNDNDDIGEFYTLSGFKIDNTPKFENPTSKPSNFNDVKRYFNSPNDQRYDEDIAKLRNSIKSQSYARNTLISETKKTEFNEKAKELKLPDYDLINDLGWSIPEFNNDGTFKGLNIKKTGNATLNSWVDYFNKDQYKNIGLPRYLVNENYSEYAQQTYQTSFYYWVYTGDVQKQEIIAELLKNPEDLHNLADKIKDTKARDEFKKAFNSDNSLGVRERYRTKILAKIREENNNDYDAVSKIYKEHIQKYRDMLIDKVNKETRLDDSLKARVITQIQKEENFVTLENSARSQQPGHGTSSIIDYEIPAEGHYPTKFYFATNYHVIDGFSENNLSSFGFQRLSNKNPSIFSKLRVNAFEDKIEKIPLPPKAFKRIFDGRDLFKWDPKDYSVDKSDETKEFVDIAIFEVDFSKLEYNDYKDKGSIEEYARWATNDYASLSEDKKLKIPTNDYLSDFDKIDVPIIANQTGKKAVEEYDQLYGVSYPATESNVFSDFHLDNYEDKHDKELGRHTFSLWTNADYELYKTDYPVGNESKIKRLKRGNHLSHSAILRTFKDKPGIYDRFLNAPVVGEIYKSKDDGKPYYQSGLAYLYKGYAPGPGASGSSIRNQNNELVSLITTGYFGQGISSGLAIRSKGLDLKGLFGQYKLPQYDLIYGGGENQSKSFRESLKEIYKNKPNMKTNLFKNGLNTIPEEHKFKNN